MPTEHDIFNRLRELTQLLEHRCAACQNAVDCGNRARILQTLDELRELWTQAQQESERLTAAQADAIVNSAMLMATLEETKDALESEIAERKSAQDQLRHDALYDSLTMLPNRALFRDRLEQCVARRRRDPRCAFALLYLDIDNFKLINDSLGHSAGDALLVQVAKRLLEGQRSADTVTRSADSTAARLGGDEFVILVEGLARPEDAVSVAERILERMSSPFTLGDRVVRITVSIGITIGTDDCDGESMLRNADVAMYRAKQSGRSRHALFDEKMHKQAVARLELENALRSALAQGEFRIAYQPIIDLATGGIHSFEALARWTHPRMGPVSPDAFIPVAEEIGLIVPLGDWVLRGAARQLAEWNEGRAAADRWSINVNVSRRQLVEAGFVNDVRAVLAETGTPASCLALEITESAVIEAPDSITRTLEQLHELGVQLHMDDFGTGYSSLSCLHRFPLDVLKIDRAFVANLTDRRDYSAVVDAVVSLARNLDMKVTAEGIESADQVAHVIALDCDYAQGFHFSVPCEVHQIDHLLSTPPPPWLRGHEGSVRSARRSA